MLAMQDTRCAYFSPRSIACAVALVGMAGQARHPPSGVRGGVCNESGRMTVRAHPKLLFEEERPSMLTRK